MISCWDGVQVNTDCSCFLFPSNIIIILPGMISIVHADKKRMGEKSAKENKDCKSKLISLVRLFRWYFYEMYKMKTKNVADCYPERRLTNSVDIYLYSY